ncbi:MAG: choice-of-anchor D domain-containing protein, partial [Bacteroidales bacterium]|nr:choice-of-anchor D domain-containing protein [Bacteroidales bacterium]
MNMRITCFFGFVLMTMAQVSLIAQTAIQPTVTGTQAAPYQVAGIENPDRVSKNVSGGDTYFKDMTPPGNALDFDGSNDYVSCGNGPVLTGSLPRTIEAWAYTRAFDDGGIFQAGGTGTNDRDFSLRTLTTEETWRINLWGSADIDVELPGSKNSWHHYCLTYDGTKARLFYDGNLVVDEARTINTVSYDFRIGIWEYSEFNGLVDEVRVWNTARTQQEIREKMTTTVDGTSTNLIAYYRFDQTEGTLLPDLTANGYNGTLYNMDNSDWVAAGWPYGAPFVTTAVLSGFTYQALTGGGEVISGGSSPVSAKGLLWGTTANPVLVSCLGYTNDGTGQGSFVSNATGLNEGTTYYFRAYAVNSTDTSYGEILSYTTGIQAPTNLLDFDGTNDYVVISNEAAFDFTNSMTVEAWIRVGSFTKTWQAIITKGDNSWRIHRYNNTGYITFDTDGTGEEHLISNTAMNDGKWHHIAAVYNGSVKYLYIDGRLDNMIVTSGSISTNDYSVMFGENAQQTGRQFDGKMDEVRIWNTALDAETIREHVHLSLQGNESGLTGYWQFNESSGLVLHDFLNSNTGNLFGFSAPACWIQSTIPLGGGTSDTRTETNGKVDFSGTGVSMFYNAHNGATVTVSKIDTIPYVFPIGNDTVFSEQYWVINRFGTGSFNANISFAPQEDILEFDELHPEALKLYSRNSNSDWIWSLVKTADSVNAVENFVVFNNLNSPGQFIIALDRNPEISIDPLLLDFGNVALGDSAILIMNIFNDGSEPLIVSGIVSDHAAFTANPSSGTILPLDNMAIEVKFKPQEYMIFSKTLTVYSNDADEPETIVTLSATCSHIYIAMMECPPDFVLESFPFNFIDVGDRSAPCLTDLENNDFLDLIVGKADGTLNHYEQQYIHSDSFLLVTDNFSGIDVGERSHPCFTDLDGNGLLDMIVGERFGRLKHYEQQSEYSSTFDLVSENFNNIDIADNSAPCFTDLDGDGLLDMIVGDNNGYLYHYEQQSIHSTSFSQVTNNFNGVYTGTDSSPTFTDVDDDGLLDLFTGNYWGTLVRHEQQSENSLIFDFVSDPYGSINTGGITIPAFTDLDANGSYDLLIGDTDGGLFHYKQKDIDTLNFRKLIPGNTLIKKYFIKASVIGNNLLLQSTNNAFEISSDENSGYSQNLTLSAVNSIITDTVFVRFEADSIMKYKGKILHIAPFMDTTRLVLEGEGAIPDNYPGYALDFDGNNDYVNCGNKNQITGNLPRTIEAWAFAESFNNGGIFQAGKNGADGEDFSLRTTNIQNQWKMQFWGTMYDLTVTLPDSKDRWHHYCMTYDGSTANLYYDGRLMATREATLNTGTNEIWLGRWQNSYFNGKIDEVRIWDYALDSIQVRENMHLNLPDGTTGLLGYWQFNEGHGTEVYNLVEGYPSALVNMDNSDWVVSTIPFGGGTSDSQIETNGAVDFSGTGLSVYYNAHNTAPVTATRIDTLPYMPPDDPDTIYSMQYWAVHRYGNGTFNADVKFSLKEDLLPEEESNLQYFRLYCRPPASDGAWTVFHTADSVNAAEDFLIFEGVEAFGQFIIGKKSSPEIDVSQTDLDFGNIIPGDSLILSFDIYNIGYDTLFVYDILTSHPDFSVNPATAIILPTEFVSIEVKFKPQDLDFYRKELTIFSNDLNESETTIVLKGLGKYPSCHTIENPSSFDLVSTNFNGIDISSNSVPTIVDLDNDGLLDLVIGAQHGDSYGTLRHYQQTDAFSASFELVSWLFNGITVSGKAKPCFADLDGNGLLDLIIGKSDGTLAHYQQQNINSLSFLPVTDNFNSIDVGDNAAPALTDLDGDGRWDLIIGEQDGNLNRFEQQSQNSLNFSMITNNFNYIDVGDNSIPNFTDLENDGLLDMVIGKELGYLEHYRQQSQNSASFITISKYFASHDFGAHSSPCFTDLDDNGLIDLLVGESYGALSHLEQKVIDTLDFGHIIPGISLVKSYFVKAGYLTDNLKIMSNDSHFAISLSENSGFSQNLSITPVDGCVSRTVYVRFTPAAITGYPGLLIHTATRMDTAYITINGTGVESENYPGNALDFDGYNDHVRCGDEVQIRGNNPRSVETWAYAREFDNGGLFQAGQTGNYVWDFSLRTTTTENTWVMQFWGNDLEVYLPGSKDSWHHYCLTYDGSVARLYYDGKLMASHTVYLYTGWNDILFGRWENSYFNGKIDEVCMWNYAMDATEIRERMHLNLSGSEPGLVGYWQFNEGSGTTVYNILGGSTGVLINMDDSDWVVSTIPFGGGVSATETETPGLVDFTGTGLSMDFNSQTGASITATRIDTVPNINPTGPYYAFNSQYWVVNRYGNGSYNADITFTLNEDLTPEHQANPSVLGLFGRGSTSDSNWDFICQAGNVNAATNQVEFFNVSDHGQFVITITNIPIISADPPIVDFGKVFTGESAIQTLEISNPGLVTLFVSGISVGNPAYNASPVSFTLLPGNHQDVDLTFTPGFAGDFNNYLTIYSNAPYQQEFTVGLLGTGIETDNFPGNALHFDSNSEYVNCGTEAQITGNNPRTIMAWANVNSFTVGGIFQAGYFSYSYSDFSLRTRGADNLWRMSFWGGDFDLILPDSKNHWRHYCMTYDGAKAKLYYDGKLMAEHEVALNTEEHDILFGRWNNYYFDGKIDEASIWDYALDSLEVRERMHLNLKGTETGLVGYWQFNEGSGNKAYNILGGSTGTLINMDNSAWVLSTIPFGGGVADSQTETSGLIDFSGTGLTMYFNAHTGAPITVSRIDTVPNINPDGPYVTLDSQYWVINRYGTGSYDADITFAVAEDLTSADQNSPADISLFLRENTTDTNWAFLASSGSVNAATDQATFAGVTVAGQFIIARKTEPAGIRLGITVFLEGPFNGIGMNTSLNPANIPLTQPYNAAPWNYSGTESVTSIPNADVVDWILIELRDTTQVSLAMPGTMIARQAAFLLRDGSVTQTDGLSNLLFNVTADDSLFVVVWHRNHLGVISGSSLQETAGVYTWDFSSGAGQANGGMLAHKEIAPGIWGMTAADGNADSQINNGDKNDVWAPQAGTGGYLSGDFNLDA